MKPIPWMLPVWLAVCAAAGEPAAVRDSDRRLSAAALSSERVTLAPSVAKQLKPVVRGSEFLVPLDLGSLSAAGQEVVVNRGGTWEAASSAIERVGDTANLVVKPDRQYIVRAKVADVGRVLGQGKDYFPGLLIRTAPAAAGAVPKVLPGQLFLQPRRMPLPWDEERGGYATKLVVGLDLTNQAGSIPLNPAVTVQFFPTGSQVEPVRVVLTNTGAEGYREVELFCQRRDGTAAVTVRSDLGEVHYADIRLDVGLGALQVTALEDRILGFGLGTTRLNVQRLAEDGQALANPQPLSVQVTALGGGKLSPESGVIIPPGESSVTIDLRSRGLGMRTVTAVAGPITSSVSIRFTPPWAFLIAALVGGAAGGLSRCFRKRPPEEPPPRPVANLVEGCLVGLVAVAAVTAGLVIGDLPAPALGTELGAFVVAALGGYYGAPLLDRMLRRTAA